VDRLRQAVREQYDPRHSTPAEVILTSAAAGADWKGL
jgi:hypothetical protein